MGMCECIHIVEVVREGFLEKEISKMKLEEVIGIWQVKAEGPVVLARK